MDSIALDRYKKGYIFIQFFQNTQKLHTKISHAFIAYCTENFIIFQTFLLLCTFCTDLGKKRPPGQARTAVF